MCPSGSLLRNVGGVLGRPKQQQYAALRSVCRSCTLKERCTKSSRRQLKVSRYYGALDRLRTDSRTESFRALYRRRAPVIEGIFAEAKQWHGLRRAWRRGLSKMKVQSLLIAAVLNLKRLMAALLAIFGVLRDTRRFFRSPLKTIGRIRLLERRTQPNTATI